MCLFDFARFWWGSLCIGVVIYSGSYLRDIAGGIMRFILSGNATITIQELIGICNSGLDLETRCSNIFFPKLEAVKRIECHAQ